MKPIRIYEPVLVLGNNRGDLDVVRHILETICTNLVVEAEEERFFEAWRRYSPKVLVLCFDPMTQASAAYLSILRKSESAHLGRHQALLLCTAQDAREACGLAVDAVFDDFAVFKPLQFPELLGLKLKQAITRADRVADLRRLAALLRNSSENLDVLKAHWNEVLIQGDSLMTHIERETSGLLRRLDSIPGESPVPDTEAIGALKRDAHRFTHEAQEALAGMVNELKTGFSDRLEPLAAQLAEDSRAAIIIAIVDDEEPVRRVLASMAEDAGFSVVTCDSGQSLLALGSRHVPDLVLMDINLPDLNGVDLTGQLKSSPSFKDVPFIMCSGLGYEEVVRKSKAAGASDFLVKPVTPKALLTKIETVLKRRTNRAQENLGHPPIVGKSAGNLGHPP